MIVMQEVALSPKITITDISDLDKWDIVISGSDELLERYVAEDPLDIQELQYEKCKRTRCCSLFPVYHGSAKDNLGTEKLIEAITETFITETDDIQSELWFLRLSIQTGKNGLLIYACIMGRSIYGMSCRCQKRKK